MKTKAMFLLPIIGILIACGGASSSEGNDISSLSELSPITLHQVQGAYDFHSPVQREYLDAGIPEEMNRDVADGKHENSKPMPLTLTWESKNKGTYEIEISEEKDFKASKKYAAEKESYEINNLKLATTYYWRVKQGDSVSDVSSFQTIGDGPRNLDIDGVTNVRDLGGWEIGNGKRINQGLLFRGARLNDSYPEGWIKGGDDSGYVFTPEITEKGCKSFTDELGIATEIDLRLSARNGYPGLPPEEQTYSAVEGVNYIAIPTGGSANINQCKEEIKLVFEIIADKKNYPVYFHCNIGTDRTGMIAYLLNAYLGVNEIDLYFDYMFSNFGLIAVPNAYDSDPTYKELADLTKVTGAAGVVSSFSGKTLAEKAKNCLLSCDIDEATLEAIKAIMLD